MRILERYILKSVVSIFLLCLTVFLSLYVIIDLFSNLGDILTQNSSFQIIVRYYLSYLPIIFTQVSPICCLLATLYAFGSLNRDNEIIAMRCAGLSVIQIAKTVIIFGALISTMVFLVTDRFVPQSLALNQRIKEQIESGKQSSIDRRNAPINNLCMYGMRNRLFFISKFMPATGIMEGITILQHDDYQNLTKKIVANKGEYLDGLWYFQQVITYNFGLDGQTKGEPRYLEEEIMAIPESPKQFLAHRQRPDHMTIVQLDEYIWKLSKSGATSVIRNLSVDLWQRFTAPLTSFIIIFLGIPFALRMRKRATGLSSLGLSIMVGFLYYVLNSVSVAFGYAGYLPPLLATSLSHVVAFSVSLYLIYLLP